MAPNPLKDEIQTHWTERADTALIERKLEAGPGPDRARVFEILAPHDQLHAGLMESTRLLARWADLPKNCAVLDIGAGLGGTARFLAEELGCRVTAIDVTPKLHEIGSAATERLGLAGRVEHRCCDFADFSPGEPYDTVLIQHVDMQIRNKDELYRCARRCCSKAGAVLWHDWLTDAEHTPAYPVMWSEDGSLSFLSSPQDFRRNIALAGLELVAFEEIGEQTKGWFQAAAGRLDAFLSKLEVSPGSAEKRKKDAESLRGEIRNALQNIENRSLIPFFARAVVK